MADLHYRIMWLLPHSYGGQLTLIVRTNCMGNCILQVIKTGEGRPGNEATTFNVQHSLFLTLTFLTMPTIKDSVSFLKWYNNDVTWKSLHYKVLCGSFDRITDTIWFNNEITVGSATSVSILVIRVIAKISTVVLWKRAHSRKSAHPLPLAQFLV